MGSLLQNATGVPENTMNRICSWLLLYPGLSKRNMSPKTLVLCLAAALVAPATEFSTFIGDTSDYHVARIQPDSAGNTYIAGSRSADGAAAEAFLMKLDPTGRITAFTTLSGKGTDTVYDLAIDASGNLYIAGATTSLNLPLRAPFQTAPGPGFIATFSPDLTQLLYSTYFPAAVRALAVDSSGGIYVTGNTNLPTFPVTRGLPAGIVTPITNVSSSSGAFITKLSGGRIVYSALIVGTDKPCGCCSSCFLSSRSTLGVAIAVDPAGNAYVAGNTDTSNIPTTPGVLLGTGTGAFVAKVNAAGTALVYLTYIGNTNYPLSPSTNPANTATGITADAAGNAYLTGSTFDATFPSTQGAYQNTFDGPQSTSLTFPFPPADAFVAKLNPTGTAMVWATYLGGKAADAGNAIALDPSGNVWIAGATASPDFPNAQGWSSGGDFVAEFNAAGTRLPYAARYPTGAASQTIACDAAGAIHFAGPAGLVSTLTPPGPPVSRIFGVANSAYGNIGGHVSPSELISIYGPHIGPSTPVTAVPDSTGEMPTTLGGVQVFAVQNGPAPAPLPLLYVSDTQINAVLPYYFGSLSLRVTNGGVTSPDFPLAALNALPEIFQNPDGTAVAVNQDLTINGPGHPAPSGSYVSIWVTGMGEPAFGLTDNGKIATAAVNSYCCTVAALDVPAYVSYSGPSPGVVGAVTQINFQVPPPPWFGYPTSVDGQFVGVVVSVEGAASHSATIYITP